MLYERTPSNIFVSFLQIKSTKIKLLYTVPAETYLHCGKHWVLSIGVTLGFRTTSFLKIGVPFLALQAGVVILWKLDDREFSLVFKKK